MVTGSIPVSSTNSDIRNRPEPPKDQRAVSIAATNEKSGETEVPVDDEGREIQAG